MFANVTNQLQEDFTISFMFLMKLIYVEKITIENQSFFWFYGRSMVLELVSKGIFNIKIKLIPVRLVLFVYLFVVRESYYNVQYQPNLLVTICDTYILSFNFVRL